MSPSRADPVLPWLGVFKYLNQCHCPGWEYLNIYISVSALAGSIYIFKSMPLPWLEVFKYLYQCHCLGWGYLNI